MPIVRLRKLECLRTGRGELTEEPYIAIFINRQFVGDCGPFSMKTGKTQEIFHGDIEASVVGLRLLESDPGKDDVLGSVEFIDDSSVEVPNMIIPQSGSYTVDLPPHRESGDAHYKLYFDIFLNPEDSLPSSQYCLQLLSIHCVNAQEWKDDVFIKVNGVKVWGPEQMRDSGSTSEKSLDHLDPIQISRITEIRLWEEDSGNRSDLFGTFSLIIDDTYNFDRTPEPIRFSRDEGITGDATYTISYRVSRRIENPDDDQLLWRYRC